MATYAELIATVQTYTQNDEATFVAELPTFVKQAEDRILHMVQLPMFRKSSDANMTADNRFLTAPNDVISIHSLAVTDASSNFSYLLNKDVNFLREAFPAQATSGLPLYYALWDEDTFLLAPTPDSGYAATLHYFYKPESLVTASSTWLGDEAEAAVLYGTLMEAHTFMKGDPDIMQVYDQRFKEALVKLKELGDGKNRTDSYRTGQVRVPIR